MVNDFYNKRTILAILYGQNKIKLINVDLNKEKKLKFQKTTKLTILMSLDNFHIDKNE